MIRWNRYAEIDGLMDIIETSESKNKPAGKGWHKAPTQKAKPFVYDPRLAFPAAHGLGISDNKLGGISTTHRRTKWNAL